jgi:DNA polymerase III delta prime subunit
MHAFLLITKDREAGEKKAHEISNKYGTVLTPITLQKIADIKELQQLTKLTLSPTAFYIENIDTITIDAANAFLKQLEEPNEHIYYILIARSEDKVLGTIVSRCEVIRLQSDKRQAKSDKNELNIFFTKSIGQQLIQLDKIKKREEAIDFMQQLIEYEHFRLIFSDFSDLSLITYHLFLSQQTLTALLKNGNVTSQLTRFVVAVNWQ